MTMPNQDKWRRTSLLVVIIVVMIEVIVVMDIEITVMMLLLIILVGIVVVWTLLMWPILNLFLDIIRCKVILPVAALAC